MTKDDLKKIKTRRTKVMAFGTFDGVHAGHLDFFRQAKKLAVNPFLIVSVARDRNVFRIKGKLPVLNEQARMSLLKNCALVDKVVLSGRGDHIPHIAREKPDIIALGYDQKAYIKNLKKDLKARGIAVKIVRLLPFKANIYKNNLLRKKR